VPSLTVENYLKSIYLIASRRDDGHAVATGEIALSLAVSPGNMAIGATFRPGDAVQAAKVSGTELRALGVNVVDAPVVDVNTNPLNSADGPRAFGDRF